MFQSARLKLTLWYVLISVLISAIFSVILFFVSHRELERSYRRIAVFQSVESQFGINLPPPPGPNPENLEIAENRVIKNLAYANLFVLILSAMTGYIFAGEALKPIKKMVDEQNQFIADASHELRTPLTSMKTAIEVNLRDKNLDTKSAKEILENNLSDIDSMKRLSDNLLLLTQFEKNVVKPLMQKVSLKEIIEEAAKKVQYLANEKNISLKTAVPKNYIVGDKEKLIQLFVIFLDNAIKYSFKGGKIYVNSEKKDGTLAVEIKDNGIGISQKDLPYIFNSFYRGDKSRSKELVDGFGLGLSIAKKIIHLHHAKVSVKSIPKKGTTFTLVFNAEK